MTRYVGVDLHRRRSMVVIMDPNGDKLSSRRIDNTPANLAAAIAEAGEAPEVVIEATWDWYWAADVVTGVGVGCIWLTRWGSPVREPAGQER